MDLLTRKHEAGRRFAPVELIEGGDHVAVQLHDGCVDRDDALAKLG